MGQQKKNARAAAARVPRGGRAPGPASRPERSLTELLEMAAARSAVSAAPPTPRPAPARRTTRIPTAPARPIDAPALAKLAGSRNPATPRLEFITNPFGALAGLGPQSLGVSYWFTPPEGPAPHRVDVRLTGHRLDVDGARTPADDFVAARTVADVAASAGPVAITQRVEGVAPGRWSVTAEAYATPTGADRSATVRLTSAEGVGRSVYAPIAASRAPGVVLGAWPTMVGLGFVLGLVVLGLLARVHGLPGGRVLLLALIAGVLGLLGARAYYRVTHLREAAGPWLAGLSVQGFVIVATVVFVLGGWAWGVRIGHLLDATIPALLLGQAVGRLGCLLAGCCYGRPSSDRWAIWSSDRTIGTRRLPVQLLESGSAGLLSLVTGVIAWRTPPEHAGLLFVAGLAAYVLVRQVLFPLRGLPRATRYGRPLMLVLAPAVLVGAVIASVRA